MSNHVSTMVWSGKDRCLAPGAWGSICVELRRGHTDATCLACASAAGTESLLPSLASSPVRILLWRTRRRCLWRGPLLSVEGHMRRSLGMGRSGLWTLPLASRLLGRDFWRPGYYPGLFRFASTDLSSLSRGNTERRRLSEMRRHASPSARCSALSGGSIKAPSPKERLPSVPSGLSARLNAFDYRTPLQKRAGSMTAIDAIPLTAGYFAATTPASSFSWPRSRV